jgi:hypothetical protein
LHVGIYRLPTLGRVMISSQKFAGRLLDGEGVVWSDAPQQGVMFTPRDIFLIPFSLLWGGFAITWETLALTGTALAAKSQPVVSIFPLWGIPFVLVGLYMIVGRFFHDAWIRSRMAYALTDRRALILRGNDLTAVDLGRVATVNLRGGSDGGRGTIVFGYDDNGMSMGWGRGWGYGRSWGYWTPSADRTPKFMNIERAQDVFNKVEALRSKQPGAQASSSQIMY